MLNLKKIRQEMNKTQKDVASFLGVDRSTYTKYETGDSEPNFEILKKLAEYFNVSIDYLLGIDENLQEDIGLSEIQKLILDLPNSSQKDVIEIIKAYVELTPENRQHYKDLTKLELQYQKRLNEKKRPSND